MLVNSGLKIAIFFFYTDSSVEAPPSFRPAKKYADLSGLPVSVLRFHYVTESVNILSLFLRAIIFATN